jgi:hypothetical protein
VSTEKVSPSEILGDSETGIKFPLSTTQRTGLYLAAGVGGLIVLVTVSLMIFLWRDYPSLPPAVGTNPTPAQSASLENYKALADLTIKNTREIFQTVVTQAPIPIFAAIVGYIFGRDIKD